ncbi:SDR family NAD(P)-dependent oxidoreductase [Litoreibacter arenae]|uniref:Oxidoreductase, short-chain dehydrogenase/reductase family n=1 Tax=Litoreibacter arenae DSM 19593 TaxID=1123360 RepID=S9QI48_9RHOB|nr:SDR family oxidoreductase [Litoreibacter arenae]EPX79258.1 Oxidoreductase, short-chain dehydrogenase/reductase family [Litoreibacter arenae DSM 19593]
MGLIRASASEKDATMTEQSSKIALVTGASRGLGSAMAEALAERGYHIIALARTVGGLEELDDRITAKGGSATLVPVDINDDDAMAQICHSIHSRWGHVDLLVHAAIHAPPLAPMEHVDAKDLDKTLATNIRATARLILNVTPLLKAAPKGQAVLFDDPEKDDKFHGAYGMSKTAQMNMGAIWRDETTKTGVTVHVLTPAPMPTATRARFYPGEDRSKLADCHTEAARLLDQLPL